MLALLCNVEYTGNRALASPDPAIPTASLGRWGRKPRELRNPVLH